VLLDVLNQIHVLSCYFCSCNVDVRCAIFRDEDESHDSAGHTCNTEQEISETIADDLDHFDIDEHYEQLEGELTTATR